MKVYKAANLPISEKIKAVKRYLQTKQSYRMIADELGVSHQTIWLWVKQYKKEGKNSFKKERLNKRGIPEDVQKKVMMLKEQNLSLSVRKAKELINKAGIQISNKGIWGIWKRYGLTDIDTRIRERLYVFTQPTPEQKIAIEAATACVKKEDYKGAAKILNSIPSLSECQLLKRIPEKFLILRRRLERLYLEAGEIPFQKLLVKARRLRKTLEEKGYVYSSMFANFLELHALDWIGKPEQMMDPLDNLSRKMRGVKNSTLKFNLYAYQISTYSHLLQVSKALEVIKKCHKLVYLLPFVYYWQYFANLLTTMGKYKQASIFFKRSLETEGDKEKIDDLRLRTVFCVYYMAGKYSKGKKMLAKVDTLKNSVKFGSLYSLTNAYLSFGQGNLIDASQLFLESLRKASKGKKHDVIFSSSVGLATLAMALNDRTQAKHYLQKYLSLMIKHRLKREELTLKCLSGTMTEINNELVLIPPYYLLNLLVHARRAMKTVDYRKAYDYAKGQKLLGLFHRWIVFFPELVLRMLEKGKNTGLPTAILRFPIFNQEIPVYHIKFLGNVIITKNQQYLKAKLTPKERAFFIHLALKAGAPNKSILLNDLYQNFWRHSKNPSNLHSHMLVKLKKKLRLPSHLIEISSKTGEARLINRGVYFTTDFGDFETLLTQARALKHADEWTFARREYWRAFKLMRGEPFRKMYDNWSENMRRAISNRSGAEVLNFANDCIEHNNKKDAEKVVHWSNRVIPHSAEIEKLSRCL
jgi:transposase-like protein